MHLLYHRKVQKSFIFKENWHFQSRSADTTLRQICEILHHETGCKKIRFYLPLPLAKRIAAGQEKKAKKTGKKPLMTTFSVYNLARNNAFDSSKARRELGYRTRPYEETIHDEVVWMRKAHLIPDSVE